MPREIKRVDFYNEPKKEPDTKEERKKYFIIGVITVLGICSLIILSVYLI